MFNTQYRGGSRKFRKRGPGQFRKKPLYRHVENIRNILGVCMPTPYQTIPGKKNFSKIRGAAAPSAPLLNPPLQ
jgi:hypothetical protein